VGGGSGVYATWLTQQGHEVELLDPVPLHVEQARAAGVTARLGDARNLDQGADSYDAVLLLGPLYHLIDRADRVRALAEAARVVRLGGVVVAAAISRYASLFDGYYRGLVDRPGFDQTIREDVRTGQHRNPDDVPGQFTTAYFHDPAHLPGELVDAGLTVEAILPIEGPVGWAPGLPDRLADPEQRELILALLLELETDPLMLAASSHLLAVGRLGR
jgi:SAM-dependent methyltransferase